MKLLLVIWMLIVLPGFSLQTSLDGCKFIQRFEGIRLHSYRCPAGVWTIGIGNTSHARPGLTITKDIAYQYLMEDLRRFEKHVNSNINRDLLQTEFDALVSFEFNCGYQVRKELKTAINLRQTSRVTTILRKYIHAGKRVLPGLVKRRNAEVRLYAYGEYN